MAISLYDATVASYLQIFDGVRRFLERGAAYFGETGVDTAEILETRLWPDMLPFRYQIVATVHHSLGAIEGVRTGSFSPPMRPPELDYAALQQLAADAETKLGALSRAEVEAFEGRDVVFQVGDYKMPFTAENFLISFSLPNFYFHATTAYDILRSKGVPLGKRDFMGQPRGKKA